MNIFLLITAVSLISGVSILSAATLDTQSSFNVTFVESAKIEDTKKNEMVIAEIIPDGSINVVNHGQTNSTIVKLEMFNGTASIYSTIFGQSVPGWQGITITEKDTNIPPLGNMTLVDKGIIEASSDLTGYITTSFGNKIKITNNLIAYELLTYREMISETNNNGTNNGMGNGTATINGMGINTHIVQREYDDARITYGVGMIGEDKSLKPYIAVNASTNFAAMMLDTDTKLQYTIPEFWQEYRYDGNSLINVSQEVPNILGYSQTRDVVGTVNVGVGDGITLSGTGKTIIQLNNYTGQELILRGDAKTSVLKLITSPFNLMTDTYDTYGFSTHTGADPSTDGISIVAGTDSTHTGHYDYSVYHPSWLHHRIDCSGQNCGGHHQRHHHHQHPAWTTYHTDGISTLVETDGGTHKIITGHTNTGSITNFRLYDTLPAYDKSVFSGVYEQKFEFLEHPTYLYVEPNGEDITIKGESAENRPFLEITNVPSNVPYQIIKNNLVIITGMSSASGQILINNINNVPSLVGGLLYLYPDSLSYRGSFSTVIFDNVHNETIHINTIEDKVYVVHAYAMIPVIGTVTVTEMDLDGTLDLPYLNKQYVGGNILVPIIPGHDTINMKINGVSASIDYANILGGTGIKIADPATSTISQYNVDAPISSAEASVGTVAYAIASSDGTLNAVITETISGTVFIQNTYILEQNPPVPTPPVRRDPLSGWVDIFVNGELVKQTSLGINPNPGFTETNTVSGNTVTRSVTYTYGDYVLIGNTSVAVSAGDFVEFYVYAKIHGDIDGYAAPNGFSIVSSSGTSSATANIAFAHIQTS